MFLITGRRTEPTIAGYQHQVGLDTKKQLLCWRPTSISFLSKCFNPAPLEHAHAAPPLTNKVSGQKPVEQEHKSKRWILIKGKKNSRQSI